jgi:hypothetical protein
VTGRGAPVGAEDANAHGGGDYGPPLTPPAVRTSDTRSRR